MQRSPVTLPVVVLSCLLATSVAAGVPAGPPQEAGVDHWRGVVSLPAGQELAFTVSFTLEPDGGTSATIDIPAQGALGLPLVDVVHTDTELSFTLGPPANAVFSAARERGASVAAGALQQHGGSFPIEMERLADGEEARSSRPQDPIPPFPYSEHEVEYVNPEDGTRLTGTLTIPEGAGLHPAVVLITGSGAQDRDEALLGHRPFLVLADHLTRNGIAVLRADDRGVGGSSGSIAGSTSADFALDALAGLELLAARPGIDGERIGLVGHSEGSMVAAMAAARTKRVAFIVMLAGAGVTGREILPMQLEAIARAQGIPEDNLSRQIVAQVALLDRMMEDAGAEVIRAAAATLIDTQLALMPEDTRPAGAARDRLVDQTAVQMTTPWFRAFLAEDPAMSLRQVRCAVLAITGSLDLQVPATENLAEIRAALAEAGNERATVEELDGLNHLFQTATLGVPAEYAMIEETIAPLALERISGWIREVTGLDGR